MKAGWKTVKLGEACKIVNGATPSTSVEANWGGPHCWITPAEMGGLSDPYVSKTRRTLTDAGLADCSASLLPTGSVILSSRAPIGHVIINAVPMATNQGCKSMIPRSDLDAKFLFYFIKANVPLLESLGTGATFKELSGGKLASVEIPLPPLAEQKRIVALLDEAFAGIDEAKVKAETNLENAGSLFNNLRECLMKEPEADVHSHGFDEICKINSVLVDPREEENANKLHVGGANIESKTGRLLDLQTARQEGLKSGKFPFEKGMVLYSKIRPNLMKVARPNFSGLCSADMYPLDPNKALICGDYLYHLLLTERFTRFALLGSERAGMPKVNRDYLSKFATKLPTVHEQKTLAMKLDSLEQALGELRELLTMKISSLTELRSAVLSEAFAGELVV